MKVKREALLQTRFNNYLRKNPQRGAFELKVASKSLPFSAVKEHQINALRAVKQSILVYKIPDDTRSYKPFDCFAMHCMPAYVVVFFAKRFYAIDIDDFISAKEESKRKSLTEAEAKKLAEFSASF